MDGTFPLLQLGSADIFNSSRQITTGFVLHHLFRSWLGYAGLTFGWRWKL